MSNIVIQVVEIIQPEIGKKQGKVVDGTGKIWQVWADKIHLFQLGQSYNITYKTSTFQGKTYHTIDQSAPAGSAAISPPSQPRPAQQAVGTVATTMPLTTKDEMIFVCGAINNTLSNPNVNPAEFTAIELIDLVKKFQATWRATLGKKPSTSDFIDDAVPF